MFRILVPLLIWQGACTLFDIPSYILPDIVSVLKILYQKRDFFIFHTSISLLEVGSALFLGLIIAFITAVSFYQNKVVKRMMMPYLLILKNMPIFVFAPLFMLWFGHGIFSKIILITLSCYFPLTIGLLDGLSRTPEAMEELMKRVEKRRFIRELTLIRLPYALPSFFTSLKLAFLHAPLSVIACDWIGASQGVGYIMLIAYGQMNLEMMFGSIVILLISGLILFRLSTMLERFLTRKFNLQYV